MFEDSFLDSYMESYIGGWTGDEDRYYAGNDGYWPGDPNQDEDSLMEYARDQEELEEIDDLDSDPEYDYPGLDDQNDY